MKKAIEKTSRKWGQSEGEVKREVLHRIKDVLAPTKKGGKTAYWLAKNSGISYNSIHGYIHGTMEPSLSNLKRIVDTFKENGISLSGKELINF